MIHNSKLVLFRWAATLLLASAMVLSISCVRKVAPAPQQTRTVTDEAGRQVIIPLRVERIISLAPNLTEIVYAIGAGDRLVGRTHYCNYPAEAAQVAEVGDTLHPSVERIIALRPQLVLVSTSSQLEAFTKELAEHQIAVYVTDPHDLEGVCASIRRLGDVLGTSVRANELQISLLDRAVVVETTAKTLPTVRVFYQLSDHPLYTAGRDSFITDLIKRAGGVSVTADVPGAWPRFSDEAALAAKPDVIILPTGGSMSTANAEAAEALRKSPAVIAGRVYKLNEDHLNRPGPRLMDGLEELAKALHPEAFKR